MKQSELVKDLAAFIYVLQNGEKRSEDEIHLLLVNWMLDNFIYMGGGEDTEV